MRDCQTAGRAQAHPLGPWRRLGASAGLSAERLAGLAAILAACVLAAASDMEAKYRLAAVAAIGAAAALAVVRERRVLCVVLWVLINPLSVQKVFFIDASEGPQFSNPTIDFNVSDAPLVLLALFLVAETLATRRLAFRWSRLASLLLALLVWSAASFAIHANWLGDGLTTAAPLALAQDARLLIFVVLVQSAVRTRGEAMLVLLAVAAAVLLQTATVGVSYATGQNFNYAAATATSDTAKGTLQGFATSGGEALLRATGTFGQVNEQAIFHVVMTFPIIAFLAARSRLVRFAGTAIVAGSALALLLTFSRGAWLAFPLGVAVCVAVALRRKMIGRSGMLAGAALLAAAAAALSLFAEPIYQRVAYGDSGATSARVRLLDLAGDLFRAHPAIGVGPGEFDEAALLMYPPGYAETQWLEPRQKVESTAVGRVEFMEMPVPGGRPYRRPLPVHNKYMLVLSELGLPGLAIWLWLCAEIVRAAWRCSRARDRFVSLLGVAALGGAVAQFVYMMVEHFHDDRTIQLVLFVAAITVAASRAAGDEAPVRLRRPEALEATVRTDERQGQPG